MATINPINDQILVIDYSPTTDDALPGPDLRDLDATKIQYGKIVAVGPGALQADDTRTTMALSVDDIIAFPKGLGIEVEVEGKPHIILAEPEVLYYFS